MAAELVFGAVGISGGLGSLIYANRLKLDSPAMVAAIAAISVIGIITENILLEFVERKRLKMGNEDLIPIMHELLVEEEKV